MAATEKLLAAALEALGESKEDARSMARGEVERGSPQLARSAFLRLAWRLVIDEDARRDGEPSWISGWMRWARTKGEPQSGTGASIERILARGVSPDDLTDVVRAMQVELLTSFCDLLDEEGLDTLRELLPPGVHVGWRLYEVDGGGHPTRPIESLHESVGGYDPSGREGEPREPRP